MSTITIDARALREPGNRWKARIEPGERDLDRADDDDPMFAPLRRRLFGIAYRVLGSSAEAEDVVQETWLRWQASDRDAVRNPAAFLATTTTRLALNVAQSARSRRETYVSEWLLEPVDTRDDPEVGAERSEALELAILLLLERLRPRERAVYVLSEAFDCSYAQIAEMLGITEVNARQLASRARKCLGGERRRQISAEERRRLLDAFLAAVCAGDRAEVEQLLASDVAGYPDDGGHPATALRPAADRERVAKSVRGIPMKPAFLALCSGPADPPR